MGKIIALIPAYNAEKTINDIILGIPSIIEKILVVDDGSNDNTNMVLSEYEHVKVITHEKNRGYGEAQKTLMDAAITEDAEYFVFIHADGGHRPEEIQVVLQPVISGEYKVSNGSRAMKILEDSKPIFSSKFLGALFFGTMPAYKFLGTRVLSKLQNIICGTNIDDFHTGMRACTKEVLEKINYTELYSGHGFDSELLLEISRNNYNIKNVPVTAVYDSEVKSTVKPIRYLFRIIFIILKNNRFYHF